MKRRFTGLALSAAVLAVIAPSLTAVAAAQVAVSTPALPVTLNDGMSDFIEGFAGTWLGPLLFLAYVAGLFASSGLSFWPAAPVREPEGPGTAGNGFVHTPSEVVQLSAYRAAISAKVTPDF